MNKNRRVIALGFFDGVHNGHGALLRRVVDKARELDAVAAAFTFDRSPTAAITGQTVPLLKPHSFVYDDSMLQPLREQHRFREECFSGEYPQNDESNDPDCL